MEFRPGKAALLSLLLVAALSRRSLEKSLPAGYREHEDPRESPGLIQCGEYSNQVLPNGKCRIVATLPQGDEQRCPDLFRCTDEVSYWLHENEERKQQILELRELISELQEELRNHRHRLKALEMQQEEAAGQNQSLLQRVQELEQHSRESSTLQHIQATLLYDIQAQINNISALADWAWRNPGGCLHPADIRVQGEMQHPGIKHGRNCPMDCASVYYTGLRRSGIYSVLPSVRGLPVEVLCDMDTEGGGWTVIQRRQDGSVDFNRTWIEYKEGFGDLNGEFWLGNDNIHRITSQGDYSLRIDLEDWNNKHKHAFYQVFSIEDEENLYRLHVDGFSGTVEDSFAWYHDKRSFSTPDSGNICAEISHGGWWYHQCFFSNLNGVYYKGGRYSIKNRKMLGPDGIVWYSWKDTDYYSLRKVVMMIRPRTFRPHLSP
ncbi:fibrinogen-like protein 1 [Oenanthe melanoleuca]|uniref:fibrinogen-like protein 1 n=1 Tax=Oenanthe melanoleuca TaxID=2939378 RepID=UPI0024C135CF|nr:fibrinogen-like protein 1 [Oenanthe melanoleuca]